MILAIRKTMIGRIAIAEQDGAITQLYLNADEAPAGVESGDTPLLAAAFGQLERYLRGELRNFDLPLAPVGTAFQQAVWRELLNIPYGRTASYAEVAAALGKPAACRAVGMANHRNPIPIFIPCHRVIGATGALVGYGGGLALKARLLELENPAFGRK
jgi:methylated-DNA-[protein]-cysteine S-methyltransferase